MEMLYDADRIYSYHKDELFIRTERNLYYESDRYQNIRC